jgi:hypothetical protein
MKDAAKINVETSFLQLGLYLFNFGFCSFAVDALYAVHYGPDDKRLNGGSNSE